MGLQSTGAVCRRDHLSRPSGLGFTNSTPLPVASESLLVTWATGRRGERYDPFRFCDRGDGGIVSIHPIGNTTSTQRNLLRMIFLFDRVAFKAPKGVLNCCTVFLLDCRGHELRAS